MTATGHAVIGAVIAAKIGNPALAIPIALLSHVVADAFPHWDTATNARKKLRSRLFIDSVIDVCISIIISYLLFTTIFPGTNLLYGYSMVFLAQFLDWATAPYYFFRIKVPPFTWSYQLQKKFDNRLDKPWGIILQVGVLLLLVSIAKVI